MPSHKHQRLVGIIARMMREKGYELVCFDGNDSAFKTLSLVTPPAIKHHKPDLIGVDLLNRRICIGEAKTYNDLYSNRTKDQFLDFSNVIINDSDKCELIIGITKESEALLLRLLKDIGILNNKNVSYVTISEVLLDEVKRDEI